MENRFLMQSNKSCVCGGNDWLYCNLSNVCIHSFILCVIAVVYVIDSIEVQPF